MTFAHVENGQIDRGPGSLPVSWRNVSGLNLSADDLPYLKSIGWLPVEDNTPPLGRDEVYLDEKTAIGADKVVVTRGVRAMTQQEIYDRDFAAWKIDMVASDGNDMARAVEDHILGDHGDTVSERALQEKFNRKRTLRATRPVAP